MHSILSNQKFFITMYKIHGKCLIWIHNCNFSYAHYQNSSSFDKVRGRFCVGILNLKCIVYHRASLSKVENRAVVPVKIWEIPKRDSISFQKTYYIEKKKKMRTKKSWSNIGIRTSYLQSEFPISKAHSEAHSILALQNCLLTCLQLKNFYNRPNCHNLSSTLINNLTHEMFCHLAPRCCSQTESLFNLQPTQR